MTELISLLIGLIILCLIIYVLYWALSQIPLPQPVRTVVWVLFALLVVAFLLQRYGGLVGL